MRPEEWPGLLLLPQGVVHRADCPNKPYEARLQWNGTRVRLGRFASIAEAEGRYNAAKRDLKRWSALQLPPPWWPQPQIVEEPPAES